MASVDDDPPPGSLPAAIGDAGGIAEVSTWTAAAAACDAAISASDSAIRCDTNVLERRGRGTWPVHQAPLP